MEIRERVFSLVIAVFCLGTSACTGVGTVTADGDELSVEEGNAPVNTADVLMADEGSEQLYSDNDTYRDFSVIINNITVLPMQVETVLENRTVYINEGKIVKIEAAGEHKALSAQTVIDGSGLFLLPGFADMHVHLWYPQDGYVFIANGVTTVRNLWGTSWHLTYGKQVAKKQFTGPEFHTSGPIMDGNPPIWEGVTVVDTPEAAQISVQKQLAEGYEEIKVYNNLSEEVYQAILAAAGAAHAPVVGHVPDAVGIIKVLSGGQKTIEHLSQYNLEAADDAEELLTAEKGAWNCPTLVMWDKWNRIEELKTADIPELKYVHPDIVADWMDHYVLPSSQEKLQKKVKSLFDHGATLLAGTDVWAPFVVPGFSLHEEFELLNQAGLPPYEILKTATVQAARYLGTSTRSGSIEDGKEADLVILSANPLEQISNTRKIEGVIVKGRYFSREKLDGLLKEVEDFYKQPARRAQLSF